MVLLGLLHLLTLLLLTELDGINSLFENLELLEVDGDLAQLVQLCLDDVVDLILKSLNFVSVYFDGLFFQLEVHLGGLDISSKLLQLVGGVRASWAVGLWSL